MRGVQPNGATIILPHPVQAAAIDALLGGHNVVVSTSTASGKSLCYMVPVLEALAADRDACALFMYPTKVCVFVLMCLCPCVCVLVCV